MFLYYKSHPQWFSPTPTITHSPLQFSPIFTDFSNAQLLLKHTTACCTENAKKRGKCDWFLLHCHSATTHHLSAMKITDCMLINSLQTHFSITIYTSSLQKSIASDTLSIPFNSCNQSLPNTEIKSHWTTHSILIESTAQLLSETHHSSHFYPISSNYTI